MSNIKFTKQLLIKIVGFGVVGLIVFGIVVYFSLMFVEKSRFNQAEKDINNLYSQIVEKIGKPDQEKSEKSCGYAARVYERGPRSCAISTYMLYENSNADQSNEKMFEISKMIGGKLYEHAAREEITQFTKYDGIGNDQGFGQDLYHISKISCGINYVYPNLPWEWKKIKSDFTDNFLIELSCGGPAMTEHYPVKK